MEIFDDNLGEVVGLLESAKSSLEHDFVRAEHAIATNDRDRLVEVLHRLTGTSGSIFAHRLHAAARSVERTARVDGVAATMPLRREFNEALAATTASISAFVRREPAS